MELYGIDFGAQMAGTTVVAHYADDNIRLYASEKKRNADSFLERVFADVASNAIVCIDAPLSLPKVYQHGVKAETGDYFYRAADRALLAMSPMFLGGLTARAMRFTASLKTRCSAVCEVYPAALAERLHLNNIGYKQEKAQIPVVYEILQGEFSCALPAMSELPSWHHVDALLCLLSAFRYAEKRHETYGDREEGVIVV